jgi:replicative DNA helicase
MKANSEILDRQPPCNLEAERAVLGSILLLPIVCDDVSLILRAEDFYDEAHRTLFTHLRALNDEGRRIDTTLLVERLRAAGQFEAVGGQRELLRRNCPRQINPPLADPQQHRHSPRCLRRVDRAP